jgi:hypothetical protein
MMIDSSRQWTKKKKEEEKTHLDERVRSGSNL